MTAKLTRAQKTNLRKLVRWAAEHDPDFKGAEGFDFDSCEAVFVEAVMVSPDEVTPRYEPVPLPDYLHDLNAAQRVVRAVAENSEATQSAIGACLLDCIDEFSSPRDTVHMKQVRGGLFLVDYAVIMLPAWAILLAAKRATEGTDE